MANRMIPLRRASNCGWATPTLFMPSPYWFQADSAPWTCLRETPPRALATIERCAACRSWAPAPSPYHDERARAPVATSVLPAGGSRA